MTTQKITSLLRHLTLFLALAGAFFSIQAQEELSETRSLDSFDKITATNGINILLRKSSEEKVDVRISNGLLSDVITEVSNGTLKVKMRPQINKELSVLLVVYYKTIKELEITKGASLETKTVILTDKLKIQAKTGGSIKAEIECKEVNLTASGGANATLFGWTKRLEAKANTKAKIQTKNLSADRAIIKVATGADAWVNATEYLEAIANTGGTIFYTTQPTKINEKVSSGGEIRNKVVKVGNDLIRNTNE